jgi:hypothetical protein
MSSRNPKARRLISACAALCIFGAMNSARASEPPTPLLNEWWQWALSIPSAINPILDSNGNRCALGQRGNLWFLAGSTGGRTERDCTLPAGGRVLIPLHNTFCSPSASLTEAQCDDAVVRNYESFTSWQVLVNGVPHEVIEQPPTPGESVFNFVIPRNGMFGYKPGLYRATSAAGRWAIVDVTAPGVYTLEVRSRSPWFAATVAYRLSVAEVL